MKRLHALILIACLPPLLAACASTGGSEDEEKAEADALLDLTQFDSDEGEFCIPLVRIDSVKVLGDQAIEFRMKGGENYINILPSKCPGLRPNSTIMYKTSQSQLCHVDIVRVLEPFVGGMRPGVSCGLGRFHPLPEGAPVVEDDTEE